MNINAPPGEYSTTFYWHYSDEDDLPVADAPGSQLAFFNVDIVVAEHSANWTVTTDVPEPANALMLLAGTLAMCSRRRAAAS